MSEKVINCEIHGAVTLTKEEAKIYVGKECPICSLIFTLPSEEEIEAMLEYYKFVRD